MYWDRRMQYNGQVKPIGLDIYSVLVRASMNQDRREEPLDRRPTIQRVAEGNCPLIPDIGHGVSYCRQEGFVMDERGQQHQLGEPYPCA